MRKNRASHLGRMKNSSYYIAPVGDRTHDLTHTVASNMGKMSHALNHSATSNTIEWFMHYPSNTIEWFIDHSDWNSVVLSPDCPQREGLSVRWHWSSYLDVQRLIFWLSTPGQWRTTTKDAVVPMMSGRQWWLICPETTESFLQPEKCLLLCELLLHKAQVA